MKGHRWLLLAMMMRRIFVVSVVVVVVSEAVGCDLELFPSFS